MLLSSEQLTLRGFPVQTTNEHLAVQLLASFFDIVITKQCRQSVSCKFVWSLGRLHLFKEVFMRWCQSIIESGAPIAADTAPQLIL